MGKMSRNEMFEDYVICIFTKKHKDLLLNLKEKYNITSIILVDNIKTLLQIKHIDILVICDDVNNKYTSKIKEKFKNIKILCVVDNNPILSMKLISKGVDGIIKKQSLNCNRWITTVYKRIRDLIKIYKFDKQLKLKKERRISKHIDFYNGKRKTDNLMRYTHA